MMLSRIPSATYRIQFHLGFRFVDARELIPYLHDLGVTELYASPRFKARRGSSHGYDVADPMRVNSELGTEKEFEELVERLGHYGMGLLLDIVPNHMSASSDNPWWLDVLENGASSPYARYFDIRWGPAAVQPAAPRKGRVLLPMLGDLYGAVLENQELTLKLDETGFFVRYFEAKLPLDPKTYHPILENALGNLSALSRAARADLERLLTVVEQLPPRTARNPAELTRRRREKETLKRGLWKLYLGRPQIRAALDKTLFALNGVKGVASSFDQLDRLLGQQAYRAAFWKLAAEEINYRRFFDVSDLVGLRVEDPEVFEARHAQIFQLIREGKVTGLRIDHIDGLRDPLGYLRRLEKSACAACAERGAHAGVYTVVEKILAEGEDLPSSWPVSGTTGYDFLNFVNEVFVDPAGLTALGEIYRRFTGVAESFEEFAYRGNRQVLEQLFNGEVNALTQALGRLAERDRWARDVPLPEYKRALVEVTACLSIYRTYIHDDAVSGRDRHYIEWAFEEARRRTPAEQAGPPAFDFLRSVLLLEPDGLDGAARQERLDFVMQWQQFTGAAMAKGLEDTALYNYHRLISLNEVGGHPGSGGKSVEDLHESLRLRLDRMPCTLNASSTHDTKRSEDVRARLSALSELHADWGRCLKKWSRLNRPRKRAVGGSLAPDPNDEILIYQTLLGVWPIPPDEPAALKERLGQFVVKALREAKTHSSWLRPDEAYEASVVGFVEALIALPPDDPFMKDFLPLAARIAFYGAFNSLSEALLKIMAPGVPDFYQGSELWDFSLVDPDNRRPVDFPGRVRALEDLRRSQAHRPLELARELAANWQDGRAKLYLIHKGLEFRKAHPAMFSAGDYVPLEPRGPRARHLIAFARRTGREWTAVAVPRLLAQISRPPAPPVGPSVWGRATTVELPQDAPDRWLNLFTGETVKSSRRRGMKSLRLPDLFSSFPVAALAPRD
jgi:(1->4)-alpha-D-glucan 1-alpha-D-glucosylmutase